MMIVELPPGHCRLRASESGLVGVALELTASSSACALRRSAARRATADEPPDPLLAEAARQLRAYFAGELREFDLPLDLSGATDFSRRVLEACLEVPYGATASYGELAGRAGSPRAARAVGQVMATNRLALVIPCHRVIGSGGTLTGYGYGLGLKALLLEMERTGGGWEDVAGEAGTASPAGREPGTASRAGRGTR